MSYYKKNSLTDFPPLVYDCKCICLSYIDLLIYRFNSTTLDRLVPKSVMLQTLCLTGPTVSCCLARRQREPTLSNQVCSQLMCDSSVLIHVAVLMMAETCLLAEQAICHPPLYDELRALQPRPTQTAETVSIAAVAAASEQNASAILVLSTSGETARLISKYRPKVPILTGTTYSYLDPRVFVC